MLMRLTLMALTGQNNSNSEASAPKSRQAIIIGEKKRVVLKFVKAVKKRRKHSKFKWKVLRNAVRIGQANGNITEGENICFFM